MTGAGSAVITGPCSPMMVSWRKGLSTRTQKALQYFVYGISFYDKDYEANPKQRCKLASFLLDMTRAKIGF